MNVKLLEEIRSNILHEPTQLNMAHWITSDLASTCGTTGCIAGWATCFVAAQEHNETGLVKGWSRFIQWSENQNTVVDVAARARELLDLTRIQGERLFYVHNWPEKFRNQYMEGEHEAKWGKKDCGRVMRAKATSERIKHFIATNGEE